AAVVAARLARGFRRVRLDAGIAQILRAGVAVDRLVRVVVDRLHLARAVALDLLAVARRLVRQRRADRGVVHSALAVRARVGLAGRVGAAAGGGDAADAGARSVAHQVGAAGGAGGDLGIARRPGGADVVGARVTVDGQVGVVVDRDDCPAAADVLLAVACRLGRDRRPGGGVGDSALAADAAPGVALGVGARAGG